MGDLTNKNKYNIPNALCWVVCNSVAFCIMSQFIILCEWTLIEQNAAS